MARKRRRRKKLRTTQELAAEFERLGKRAEPAITEFLWRESWNVFEASQEMVPVDEGDLRDSGRVEGPKKRGRGMAVEVIYGGPDAEHAIVIHEAEGGVKYLSQPFKKNRRGMAKRLVRHLRKEL